MFYDLSLFLLIKTTLFNTRDKFNMFNKPVENRYGLELPGYKNIAQLIAAHKIYLG